jgi:hypothetical protein
MDLDEAKVRAARKLHDDHTSTIDDICKTLNISKFDAARVFWKCAM